MLWHTFVMGTVAPLFEHESSIETGVRDSRTDQTLALVKTLLSSLPVAEQERFCREIIEKSRLMAAPRAGVVLSEVVRLLPQRKEWSVAELKNRVDERGVSATSKEVYNAVGYLARKGRVRRVGYGRYMVDGVQFETSDDFGGETTRHEDEYRTNRD